MCQLHRIDLALTTRHCELGGLLGGQRVQWLPKMSSMTRVLPYSCFSRGSSSLYKRACPSPVTCGIYQPLTKSCQVQVLGPFGQLERRFLYSFFWAFRKQYSKEWFRRGAQLQWEPLPIGSSESIYSCALKLTLTRDKYSQEGWVSWKNKCLRISPSNSSWISDTSLLTQEESTAGEGTENKAEHGPSVLSWGKRQKAQCQAHGELSRAAC